MTRLTYVIDTTGPDPRCATCLYYENKICTAHGSDHFGHYLAPAHVDCEKYIRVEREG